MLREIRVVDMSTVLAGPSVGTFFAELGATVIKVEHPINKDVTRTWKLPGEDPETDISAYFSSINFNKDYLFLDLKEKSDYKQFIELISNADILITNFKKGDDKKLNIEDALLHDINPRLIIGKINGYGENSDRVAYDLILQAESGFMSINGTPESGPVKMPVALIDVLAAHHLKEGILLALYERQKNGKGKSVSVSLYEAAISSLVNQASNFLMTGHIPERIGSLHPNIAPYGEIFKTADNILITLAIGSDRHFQRLCSLLELNQLPTNEKFKINQNRVENRQELAAILGERISNFRADTLIEPLKRANVPVGMIMNLKDVFEDDLAKSMIRKELINGVLTKRVTSIAFR